MEQLIRYVRTHSRTNARHHGCSSDTKLSKSASDNVKSSYLTFGKQSVVESLIDVLSPLKMATEILCAEKCPTMNKVIGYFSKD